MAINIFQTAAMNLGRRLFTTSWSTRLPSMISLTTESGALHKFFDPPHPLHSSPVPEPPTSSLGKLAATITRETEKLSAYLKDNGIEEPSFDVTSAVAFPKLPEDLRKSREEIIIATKELGDLVTGAEEGLRWLAISTMFSPFKQYIITILLIPLGGTATFKEIAQKGWTRRHQLSHTTASKMLAEDQSMMDWVGVCVEECWPLLSPPRRASASPTELWILNICLSPLESPPFVQNASEEPWQSFTSGEGYEISHLVENYDWASIDSYSGTIVDLGGSHGFVCIELAKKFSNLNFIVQDLSKTIASAPELDASISPRIKYMVHGFHNPQPIKNADVYMFRWVMHNHSNKYATNMLCQLKPALKKGAKVLINDYCLPQTGKGSVGLDEKAMRTMDINMLSILNAQERGESDWAELFGAVKGFRFLGVKRPVGCRMSLIEAVWEGE
ncbi:hypothetical protein DID88_007262 [Monilinia fructigena]|uniref:O-methyltransferase C-terminal domain-containing protein n=1 Tax=Monilinia fructigena TaxID=38457 RepID=A0A395J7Q8_9HELO|nr:hypothetical protein DID88_007262 [Monilinia fructigena]